MVEKLDIGAFTNQMARLLKGVEFAHVAVAISGGADSVCLAHLLKQWTSARSTELTALTVDHRLRPESAHEAEIVQGQMRNIGVHHEILVWQHQEIKSKIQEEARKARYRLLTAYCLENGISHLFLAHHGDDQAETLLYRLSRASGMDGLACMLPLTTRNGIFIARPLLNFSQQAIKDYLRENNLTWIDDPSNHNPSFTRIKIRQFLPKLEAIGVTAKTLNQVTRKLQRSRNALELYTKEFLREHGVFYDTGYVTLSLPERWPPEDILLRALSWILWHVSGSLYPPRQERTEAFMRKIQSAFFKPATCGGCYVIRQGNFFVFMREQNLLPGGAIVKNGLFCWDNRFEIEVRDLQAEMTLSSLGRCARLRELHPRIPRYVLEGLPALKKDEEIVAVPILNDYPRLDIVKPQNIVSWTYNPKKNLFRELFTIA